MLLVLLFQHLRDLLCWKSSSPSESCWEQDSILGLEELNKPEALFLAFPAASRPTSLLTSNLTSVRLRMGSLVPGMVAVTVAADEVDRAQVEVVRKLQWYKFTSLELRFGGSSNDILITMVLNIASGCFTLSLIYQHPSHFCELPNIILIKTQFRVFIKTIGPDLLLPSCV